jgi:hypothetical protein
MPLRRQRRRTTVLAASIAFTTFASVSTCADSPTGPRRPEEVVSVTITGPAIGGGIPRGLQVTPGTSAQMTAEVRDQTGHLNREYPVEWASSNPAIFTVDSTGLVWGRAPGQGTLTATAKGTTVSGTIPVILTSVAISADAQ